MPGELGPVIDCRAPALGKQEELRGGGHALACFCFVTELLLFCSVRSKLKYLFSCRAGDIQKCATLRGTCLAAPGGPASTASKVYIRSSFCARSAYSIKLE